VKFDHGMKNMKSISFVVARCLVFLFLLSLARPALSGPTQGLSKAERDAVLSLYNEGKALIESGQIAEACKRFEEGKQIDATAINLLLRLGDCYERLGRTESAYTQFQEAASVAASQGDARKEKALERAKALEPKLPRAEEEVVVEEPKKPAPLPAPLSREAPEPKAPFFSPRRVAAIAMAAAGLAGIGVGAAFGLEAKADNDASNTGHCNPQSQCDALGFDLRKDAQREALISTVAFSAGAAVLAGSAILFFVSPDHPLDPKATGKKTQTPSLEVGIGPRGGILSLKGTF